jgi:hypothetical protein
LLVKEKGVYGIMKPAIFSMKKNDKNMALDYIDNKGEIKNDSLLYAFSYYTAECIKEYGSKPVPYSVFLVGQKKDYDSLVKLKYEVDINNIVKGALK